MIVRALLNNRRNAGRMGPMTDLVRKKCQACEEGTPPLPPGTPKDRVAILQEAMRKALQDTDMHREFQKLVGEDVEIVTLPAADLWPVKIDPGQFEQILMNLAVNARDAMPEGGRLVVETANVIVGEAKGVRVVGMPPGEYVLLAVEDTGVGMTPDVKERIFDPFFTTKAPGKGTGLGLSICYGIIAEHRGRIEVESQIGVGSNFKVYLPIP